MSKREEQLDEKLARLELTTASMADLVNEIDRLREIEEEAKTFINVAKEEGLKSELAEKSFENLEFLLYPTRFFR